MNCNFLSINWRKKLWVAGILLLVLIIFCEFLIYYLVLYSCKWPNVSSSEQPPVKAMILADTHILGPFRGHWLDKLRREWQMHRAFQTSMTLFNPEVVFILGDLFDEGDFVDSQYFAGYATHFHKLFHTPKHTKLICAAGNHDVGFHYRMHPYFLDRFKMNFNNTGVELHTIRNVHFVTLNSMAMEGDQCYFCDRAERQLNKISNILKCAKNEKYCSKATKKNIQYSRPVLLQHFPTYRSSDEECIEHDAPKLEKYREKWDVLSKEATFLVGEKLNPRVAFSGHSHHYCKIKNSLDIEEYTIASFSWRNKYNPSFLLVSFTPNQYAVEICYMPIETTLVSTYIFGTIAIVLLFLAGLVENY